MHALVDGGAILARGRWKSIGKSAQKLSVENNFPVAESAHQTKKTCATQDRKRFTLRCWRLRYEVLLLPPPPTSQKLIWRHPAPAS